MSRSFSAFIFSTGIKLFIRHPAVLFSILILSEQFDGFVQLHPLCILHEYVNTEFDIPLLLRQNESRYKCVCVCMCLCVCEASSVCKMSKTYLRVQINDLVLWILVVWLMSGSIISVSEYIFHLETKLQLTATGEKW